MARRSRKQNGTDAAVQSIGERIYHAALYVRLSVEDSGSGNRDAIAMQQYLLQQYAEAQPDLFVQAVFIDNGATGTNFERPGFEKMMEAVRKRQIDCIIVKDLSRFGRNYVETGYFLEKIFPFLGVRFIAINDNCDTLKKTDGDEMTTSLKNIINALIAKDISRKTSTALHLKQEKGQYIGSWAPYGYLKSPEDKHRLIADPQTAPVVEMIFQWRLQGCGYAAIARRLNLQKIPSPNMLRFLRGAFKKTEPSALGRLWQRKTVRLITENIVYIGHMAQGKHIRSLYDGLPSAERNRNDWIVVPCTHEPIIDKDTFYQVQEMNRQRRKESIAKKGNDPVTENMFRGKLYCGDCGAKMFRKKNVYKKGDICYRYLCPNHSENGNTAGCFQKGIDEGDLLDLVLKSLGMQVVMGIKQNSQRLSVHPVDEAAQASVEQVIEKAQADILQNRARKATLFENYTNKLLTDEEYRTQKGQCAIRAAQLDEKMQRLKQQRMSLPAVARQQRDAWLWGNFQEDAGGLTNRHIAALVDCVIVEKSNDIRVVWNFRDEYQALLASEKGALS